MEDILFFIYYSFIFLRNFELDTTHELKVK